MRENRLRKIWASGGAVINGWLGIPSGFSAEVMANQGWDSLCVDLQHGINDYQVGVSMLQAISTTATVPLCRVPWNEQGIIGKMLDAGCYGVVCPMVNTKADADQFAKAMRYAPRGGRSFGPIRALIYGGPDYPQHANDTVLAIAQIETPQAIENLEAICGHPEIDVLYIGPADLALGYGKTPKFDHDDPGVHAAILRTRDIAKKHGKIAGIHCGTTEYARKMIAEGFQMVTVLSDSRIMAMGAANIVKAMREPAGAAAAPVKVAAGGSY